MRVMKILGALAALCLLVAGGATVWAWSQAQAFLAATPSSAHDERILTIPRGAGPQTVAGLLAEAQVVTDAEKFALYLRIEKAAAGLRAGEYRFWTDQTPADVLDVLLHAPEVTYPLTLPPGLRIEDMAALVEAAGMGSAAEYARLARDAAFIESLSLPFAAVPESLEGLLVPETYNLGPGADERAVVAAQIALLREIWTPERSARATEIGLSPYQVMIMASLVEKETALPEERPRIAAVFHNRLRLGMRLETDPTIIYGLKNYDGNIRSADIRRPHRWNTYVIPGLPPTPIAGAGIEAIDGVLHPTDTKDLFFVAKGGGAHHFSEGYAEHARMVRKYILKQ